MDAPSQIIRESTRKLDVPARPLVHYNNIYISALYRHTIRRVNRFLSWIGSSTYDACYCENWIVSYANKSFELSTTLLIIFKVYCQITYFKLNFMYFRYVIYLLFLWSNNKLRIKKWFCWLGLLLLPLKRDQGIHWFQYSARTLYRRGIKV